MHAVQTSTPDLSALPAPLRALAERHEQERRAVLMADADAARAELATLSDDEPRRLLAVAAKIRGEAEALRVKLTDAEARADAAHAAYVHASSDLTDRRTRLRRRAVPDFVMAEAVQALDTGEETLRARYAHGRRSDRAAVTAMIHALRPCRLDLAQLRDGCADVPDRPLTELVREALARAEEAARTAADAEEERRREADRKAELRRVFG